jgi:cysteinyl-tRNA synthetase
MKLYLYNTLTKSKQLFVPIDSKRVRMYVCGPTVYDLIHIGNARTNIVYDILYRILINLYGDSAVQYVRNITDIDDKIIARAHELKITVKELTTNTIKEFEKDNFYLGCLTPSLQPRATDYVDAMISIIKILIDQKFAYVVDGHVYFDVSKTLKYTELTGRRLKDLIPGSDENSSKKAKEDFVLWKPAKSTEDLDAVFESPWSKGRPGWHIECSAMINEAFGPDFDIHGGGIDLIFPHHTNEIAQSKCAFAGSNYAKYWVHTGFLTKEKEKMSKSLKNFITVRELKNRGISAEVFRMFILNSHYRKPIDFSEKNLQDSAKKLNYLYRALEISQYSSNVNCDKSKIENYKLPEEFMSILLDDMNTHMAITYLHKEAEKIHKGISSLQPGIILNFVQCANFLGFLTQKNWKSGFSTLSESKIQQIERLINQRKVARDKNQWKKSDKIRDNLLKVGIRLEDHKDNTTTWSLD